MGGNRVLVVVAGCVLMSLGEFFNFCVYVFWANWRIYILGAVILSLYAIKKGRESDEA